MRLRWTSAVLAASLVLTACGGSGKDDIADQSAGYQAGDGILRRVAELPQAIRGSAERPRGVLAKAPKPIQETKVDLPTIGVATIQRAARAGLAGVVGEAGRLLVVDREAVTACADDLGLFVLGVDPRGRI